MSGQRLSAALCRVLVPCFGGGDIWDAMLQGAIQGFVMGFSIVLVIFAVSAAASAVASKVQAANAVGYHATKPEFASSIKKNGFRLSPGGRAGGGGVYVNNTKKGAIAEYWHYNPGGSNPMVLKVKYNPGKQMSFVNLGDHIHSSILPDADTIIFESLRMPGTFNILVKNGSIIIIN